MSPRRRPRSASVRDAPLICVRVPTSRGMNLTPRMSFCFPRETVRVVPDPTRMSSLRMRSATERRSCLSIRDATGTPPGPARGKQRIDPFSGPAAKGRVTGRLVIEARIREPADSPARRSHPEALLPGALTRSAVWSAAWRGYVELVRNARLLRTSKRARCALIAPEPTTISSRHAQVLVDHAVVLAPLAVRSRHLRERCISGASSPLVPAPRRRSSSIMSEPNRCAT